MVSLHFQAFQVIGYASIGPIKTQINIGGGHMLPTPFGQRKLQNVILENWWLIYRSLITRNFPKLRTK